MNTKRYVTSALLTVVFVWMIPPVVEAGYRDGMSLYEYVGSGPAVAVDPRGLAIVVFDALDPDPPKERQKQVEGKNRFLKGFEGEARPATHRAGRRAGEVAYYARQVVKNTTPELYDKYRRKYVHLSGTKEQMFEKIKKTLEEVKDCPENHVVFASHGQSYEGEDAAFTLKSHEEVMIPFDDFRGLLGELKGKYNTKTFALMACDISKETAASFRHKLGGDVSFYYYQGLIKFSQPRWRANVSLTGQRQTWGRYKGKPLRSLTETYKTEPYDPAKVRWRAEEKDAEGKPIFQSLKKLE